MGGVLAPRTLSLARENHIPVKEDPYPVQVLSQVDVGEEIPPTVYQVVSELLAFIYKINEKSRRKTGNNG